MNYEFLYADKVQCRDGQPRSQNVLGFDDFQ